MCGAEHQDEIKNGMLFARVESGNRDTRAQYINSAVYVSHGTDPYELINRVYTAISKQFKTNKDISSAQERAYRKLLPTHDDAGQSQV